MAESIFLPPREMTRLMHGDLVRVQASQGSDERWSGAVVDVLERGVAAFLGTISIQGRSASVQSADRRLNLYCIVQPADLNGARNGDWVIARVVKYPLDGQAGTARVELLLDPEKPLTLATEAAIAKLGLPRDFSPEAVRDAEAQGSSVDPREAARRVDLRNLPLVTIDGEDARDFDDAVYAEPQRRRIPAHRGHCRCESLRARGHDAGCRGAAARHFRVLSSTCSPHAAAGAVRRAVFACSRAWIACA